MRFLVLFFMLLSVQFQNAQQYTAILVDDQCDPSVRKLVDRLNQLQHKGIMFGHEDATAYGLSWKYKDNPGRSDVKEACGDYPAVFGWDIGHLELDSPMNLDTVNFELMNQLITEAHESGGIITISWHLNDPVTGESSWVQNQSVKEILPGQTYYPKYKSWVQKVAVFFHALKDQHGNSIPVIFRPYHEMNGSWFWWGEKHCTVEEYIQLWHTTVSLLRDEYQVHNLLYAYSPNAYTSRKEFMDRYPGDEWVDLLGLDIYDRHGDYNDFVKPLKKGLEVLQEVANEKGKLYALTETGRDQVEDADWWTRVLYPAIHKTGISYVLVWRNAWPDEYYAPFEGQKSAPDFKVFYEYEDILFLNDIQD
jgi:mannan endo-1,4-beta-mannosidase